jgi:pimeloyl-ACP methyl ester carboxylesterase
VVAGGAGLKLHVRDWGSVDAPAILLIHGWSQQHLCWRKQTEGPLTDVLRLVAMDLRGHGQSEAPLDAENYTTGELWADDVAAVIATLRLAAPVLVGWSYGGLVIGDYLRKYGDASIAGLNLVSAAIGIGPAWFGSMIGSVFVEQAPRACSEDQAVALKAVQSLVRSFFVHPATPEDVDRAIRWSLATHPAVRAGLIQRDEDFRPELSRVRKPVLVSYGAADTVVLPAMAMAVQASSPSARMAEYDGAGHALFLEQPARFNSELATFAREVTQFE